jgi:hypothetical protein
LTGESFCQDKAAFSLERKVPKVQERNDMQHISFFRLDFTFVVSPLQQLRQKPATCTVQFPEAVAT